MGATFHDLMEAQQKAVEARKIMAKKQRSRASVQFIEAEEIALSVDETPAIDEPDRSGIPFAKP